MDTPMVCSKVFSRIGLLGNPSDGFFGKTIAVSCANFWAEVFVSSCIEFWNDALDNFNVFAMLTHELMHAVWLLQVQLKPADTISFKPHAQHDLLEYTSLDHLTQQIAQQGYYGGIRLLMVLMC